MSSPSRDLRHSEAQALFFTALSDASRIMIIDLLLEVPELTMTEIQEATGFSQTKTSRHLALLRRYEFVETRKEQAFVFYRLRSELRERLKRCLE